MALGELATLRDGGRLILRTRVEPFIRARTTSWFEDARPESGRTLIVEPEGAWMEMRGERKPLPARQAAHERAQYGLYGYLLEAMQPGAPAHLSHAGLPPIDFLHAGGRPISARYTVPDHASDGTIAQQIHFEGAVADGGVTWPGRISLGSPGALPEDFHFRITIDSFTVIPA